MKHNKALTYLAQKLRKEMTKEEKQLWYQFLKKHPTQFKRQVTCGKYILDFYCPSAKLAIELDGSYHRFAEVSYNDKMRTEYLGSLGIHVLRYQNCDIWNNFDQVCLQIDFTVKQRTSSVPRDARDTFPKGEG